MSCDNICYLRYKSNGAIRIIIFFLLTGGFLYGVFNLIYHDWSLQVEEDEFKLVSCNPFNITRPIISGVKWFHILDDRFYNKYIFDIYNGGNNKKITYYSSELFIVVPYNIIRLFTFDLINLNPYEITFTSNNTDCEINKNLIELMFNDIDRNGLITDVSYDHNTTSQMISLLIFNGILGLCITFYGLKFIYQKSYSAWESTVNRLGRKYYAGAFNKGKFSDYKKEVCGPFFLIDFIYGCPIENKKKCKNSIISSLIHFASFHTIMIPFIIAMYYSDIKPLNYTLYGYVCLYDLIISLYALSYYINLKWKYRKYSSKIVYFFIAFSIVLSFLYIVNCILWVVFSISIEPFQALAAIIFVATIVLYIHIIYTEIRKYNTKISLRYDSDDDILSDDDLPSDDEIPHFDKSVESYENENENEEYCNEQIENNEPNLENSIQESNVDDQSGFSRKPDKASTIYNIPYRRIIKKKCKISAYDNIMMLIFGLLLIFLLITWVILIWRVIGINKKNIYSFVSALIVPLSSAYNTVTDLNNIKNKIENNLPDQTPSNNDNNSCLNKLHSKDMRNTYIPSSPEIAKMFTNTSFRRGSENGSLKSIVILNPNPTSQGINSETNNIDIKERMNLKSDKDNKKSSFLKENLKVTSLVKDSMDENKGYIRTSPLTTPTTTLSLQNKYHLASIVNDTSHNTSNKTPNLSIHSQ